MALNPAGYRGSDKTGLAEARNPVMIHLIWFKGLHHPPSLEY